MAESTVAAPEVQTPTTESTRHHERYVAPPVDIYETHEGLVVLADLPGVAQEGLDIRVDNHVLTIRGRAHHAVPGEAICICSHDTGHMWEASSPHLLQNL